MNQNTHSNGGPAYPQMYHQKTGYDSNGNSIYQMRCDGGMSLRDYFAGKALEALIARDADDSAYGIDMIKARPRIAFEYADAMIAARNS